MSSTHAPDPDDMQAAHDAQQAAEQEHREAERDAREAVVEAILATSAHAGLSATAAAAAVVAGLEAHDAQREARVAALTAEDPWAADAARRLNVSVARLQACLALRSPETGAVQVHGDDLAALLGTVPPF